MREDNDGISIDLNYRFDDFLINSKAYGFRTALSIDFDETVDRFGKKLENLVYLLSKMNEKRDRISRQQAHDKSPGVLT